MSEQSTEEQIRDLAAAVIEALTVPRAKTAKDHHKAEELMRDRAAVVRGALSVVAEGEAPEHAAWAIRVSIAGYPTTYEPIAAEGAEPLSLGVSALPAAWSAQVSA